MGIKVVFSKNILPNRIFCKVLGIIRRYTSIINYFCMPMAIFTMKFEKKNGYSKFFRLGRRLAGQKYCHEQILVNSLLQSYSPREDRGRMH